MLELAWQPWKQLNAVRHRCHQIPQYTVNTVWSLKIHPLVLTASFLWCTAWWDASDDRWYADWRARITDTLLLFLKGLNLDVMQDSWPHRACNRGATTQFHPLRHNVEDGGICFYSSASEHFIMNIQLDVNCTLYTICHIHLQYYTFKDNKCISGHSPDSWHILFQVNHPTTPFPAFDHLT